MTTYARGTSVPVRKSRMEIEDMLSRHRATRTFTAAEDGRAIVGFTLEDRFIQFELALPLRSQFEHGTRRGRRIRLAPPAAEAAWEQACREKWRALVLALKSKFVSIEAGIETVEQAFLAHILLPNRETVHHWFKGQLARSYEEGGMPKLLPGGEVSP